MLQVLLINDCQSRFQAVRFSYRCIIATGFLSQNSNLANGAWNGFSLQGYLLDHFTSMTILKKHLRYLQVLKFH